MNTRETIERYFDQLKHKSGWESLLADDVTFTSFTIPNKRVEGKTAYVQATKRFYSTIVRFEVRDLMVDGDRACALTHYDLQPPNGGPAFQSDVAEIFSVNDGKIASLGIYFDSAPFPKS
jgi:ketosteroid isomerase-like protein